MTPLSDREQQLYACIQWFIKTHYIAPTLVEMGKSLNISKTTANICLQRLIKKGYVARQHRTERGLTLINQE